MCHGARCGGEAHEMQRVLPNATVTATDLLPKADHVTRWDFRKKRRRWIGAFDIIYSNSFDHTDEPLQTAKVWLRQLSPTGRLFVEWTRWHAHRPKHGDCFCAEFHEYVAIFEEAGKVEDVIYLGDCRFLIVVSKP